MTAPDRQELQTVAGQAVLGIRARVRGGGGKRNARAALRHAGEAGSVGNAAERGVAESGKFHAVADQQGQCKIVLFAEFCSRNGRSAKGSRSPILFWRKSFLGVWFLMCRVSCWQGICGAIWTTIRRFYGSEGLCWY